MRLLAVGDQHIGAGADLGHKPGDRLAEQEAVWAWTLAQAREHQVDAIVHAGDVFQHRKPDPETLLAFERPLVEHLETFCGPKPLVIVGNHCISSLDTGCALDVFHEAGLIELVREPRVVLVEGGARVACLPWTPTSRLAANYDGPRDLLNEHAATLLIEAARDLFADALTKPEVELGAGVAQQVERGRQVVPEAAGSRPVPGSDVSTRAGASGSVSASPIILLTHFSITGTSLPSGLDVGQLRDPVLAQEDLLAIGYDLIVAGHIHKPQMIGGDRGFYVGSPMPLSFGEADGQVRGPRMVEWRDGLTVCQQLAAPSRRFVNLDVGPPHLCVYHNADIADAYVKVRVRGTEREVAAADVPQIRARLEADGAYRVFVETVVEREARARDVSVDDSLDETEALSRWLAAQNGSVDHEVASRALERAAGYFERVRS